MSRTKSSDRWLKRFHKDAYVKQAQQRGYRSRASFKLLELAEKDQLFRRGMCVVDLGAAPGGWSQVAMQAIGEKGKVIALDRLDIDPLADVIILKEDFTTDQGYQALIDVLEGQPVDLVLSDMAPNISGMKIRDQAEAMELAELALDFARQVLKPNGNLVTKVFQGDGFEAYLKQSRESFITVKSRKPKSSRNESREQYIVAKGFKGK